ncbi:unnamed protein product [Musa acuminata subsp. malaccensis]|uniref:Auxin-responsive protein n=1 Tax=Musa acuminata subsp. malaccensis TaxID=214687 RepID=A0A804L5A1_MUSAM|nr:unnamed protein product [Musa acuminata subsp. malaccensis]
MVEEVSAGAAGETEEEVRNEEELGLGLTLGRLGRGSRCRRRGAVLAHLDRQELPLAGVARLSDVPNRLLGLLVLRHQPGFAGTKRAAESVSPDSPPPPNSQVAVGWPPIRAFRMNRLFNHSKDSTSNSLKKTNLIIGNNDQENKGKETRNSLFVKLKWMVILYVGRWISLPIILINLLKLHLSSCFRSLLWALPFGLYLWSKGFKVVRWFF